MRLKPLPVVLGIAYLVRLFMVFAIDPAYGFHRDEFLYFAMADHLEPWRMQFPPFIALVGRISLALFGDTHVMAARIPATLGATALTAVALLIARRLGASTIALVLTALALLAAPIYVRPGILFQPVIFDQLWYALAAYGLLRASQDDDTRAGWMIVGLGLGLGGLTKFSAAFYAVGFVVATLATPRLRQQLTTRWPWMSVALAASIALPSFTGQIVNGWPVLAQARVLQEGQLQHTAYGAYLSEQIMILSGAFPLVGFAVYGALRIEALRSSRPLIVSGATIVLLFLVMNGKGYYAGPAYVPIIAIGATATAMIGARVRVRVRVAAPAMIALCAASAILLLPAGVPVFAPPLMSRYALALGITRTNVGTTLALPQDYADMTGWEEQTNAIADAWERLTPEERRDAAIAASNYGEAGALARFAPPRGLPYPISRAGDFWAWGPGSPTTKHLLVIGARPDDLAPVCEEATEVARVPNATGVEEERDVPITFCRGLKQPLPELWARLGAEWG